MCSKRGRRSKRSSPWIPTNANAAYELAEMHRKAGEFEPGAQTLRAGGDALSGVRAGARRTRANARSRSVGRLKRCRICRRLSRAILRTRSPTIKSRRHTGHSATPLSRRKRSPSSTACAASLQGSAPRCPRQSGTSRRRCSTSSLRNERERAARGCPSGSGVRLGHASAAWSGDCARLGRPRASRSPTSRKRAGLRSRTSGRLTRSTSSNQ